MAYMDTDSSSLYMYVDKTPKPPLNFSDLNMCI